MSATPEVRCPVCRRTDGSHKMSCRPENREAAASRVTPEVRYWRHPWSHRDVVTTLGHADVLLELANGAR